MASSSSQQATEMGKMAASSSSSSLRLETPDEDNMIFLSRYLRLYKDILSGDLEDIKFIRTQDQNMLEARITENSDTPLHVAVATGTANHVVDYLLHRMTQAQLSLRNNDGDTVLSIAAIVGNLRAAKKIVEKHPSLTQIANHDGRVPLLEAARHGHKEMIFYLLRYSEGLLQAAEYSADKPGVLFMNFLIIAGFYDIALGSVLQKYPSIATVEFYGGDSPLSAMAAKPSSFPSGMHLNFWQRPLYNFSYTKDMRQKKLMHEQALELVKALCKKITSQDYAKASSLLKRPLLLGAKLGIGELVQEIMQSFPHAIWFTDSENHNMFHLAVLNRQENIFNLIYEMGDYKRLLLVPEDTSGNNILHLAGKLAPSDRLNITSGAALQMQRELQWFKEVERIVQPSFKEDRNSEGKTPATVFTEAHRFLVKEGEKWMKDTASSCSLVAVLIATVVFAAAITVPGGNDQTHGYPLFKNDKVFIVFAISDALSLFSAIAAILMFLSILTARYAESDFLYALPKRLIYGLVSMFLSITSMMVAFGATLFLVFCDKKLWTLIPVGLFACLPVSLFVSLQFPLLVSIISSTYGPGFFGKHKTRMLFATSRQ